MATLTKLNTKCPQDQGDQFIQCYKKKKKTTTKTHHFSEKSNKIQDRTMLVYHIRITYKCTETRKYDSGIINNINKW